MLPPFCLSRSYLIAVILAILILGIPVHLVRVSQLSIDYSVSGRGVLQLTAMEQKFFMLGGLAMLIEIVMLMESVEIGIWGCKLVSFFNSMVTVLGTTSGTSIAVCR